jgi:hypothetical protein
VARETLRVDQIERVEVGRRTRSLRGTHSKVTTPRRFTPSSMSW